MENFETLFMLRLYLPFIPEKILNISLTQKLR